MKKKGLAATVITLALAVCLVTGCTWKQEKETENIEKELVTVGFSQVGAESDWRTANSVSVKDTFTLERGYNLLFEDARQKQSNQIRAIRGFIQQGVDYIVFSPVVEKGWDTVLEEAKRAEIPVIVIDRMIDVEDEQLYEAWIGSDFYMQGRKACEVLRQYINMHHIEEVNIVNIQGTIGATSQVERSKALEETAEKYGWNLLAQESGEYTQAKSYEVMKEMLEKYENINFVYCENDNEALGVIDAIRDAGKQVGTDDGIHVISFDATKKGLESTLKGEILINMECNPLQGPGAERVIRKLEAGEEVTKQQYVSEQIFMYGEEVPEIQLGGKRYEIVPVTAEIIEGREY